MSRFVLEDPASGLGLLRDALQGTPIPGVPSAASPLLLLDALTGVADFSRWLQELGRSPVQVTRDSIPAPAAANTINQQLVPIASTEPLFILAASLYSTSTVNFASASIAHIDGGIDTYRILAGGTGNILTTDGVGGARYLFTQFNQGAPTWLPRPVYFDPLVDRISAHVASGGGGAMAQPTQVTIQWVPVRVLGVPQVGLW